MLSSAYIDEFMEGMETSGRALYNKTVGMIRDMDTDAGGGLIRSQKNNRIVGNLSAVYSDFLDSRTYNGRIDALLESIPKIGVELSQQYLQQYGDIDPRVLRQAVQITENFQYALEGALTDEAVEYAIFSPVINDIFYAIGAGREPDANYTDIMAVFTDYFTRNAAYIILQYERTLNSLYGEAFQAKAWLYDGIDDELCRPFCAQRVGKEYTDKEVDAWASEDWAGKIPGTTASNIRLNCGGYNCRHQLIPA